MTDIPQNQGISTSYFIDTIARKSGIDTEVLAMLGYGSKAEFSKDWHMRAAKSLYQGIPCHYVVHSAIEYVFVDEDNAHLVLAPDQAQARQAQISVLADYFDDSLAEMEGAEKALSDKDYFEFMRQFQLSWQKELESFRIPMGAFAQHQCDYSKVAAAFDRKFFGKNLSLTHENSSLNP